MCESVSSSSPAKKHGIKKSAGNTPGRFVSISRYLLELVFIGVYLRLFGKFCCILR